MIKEIINLIKSGKIKISRGFTFFAQLPDGSDTPHICIVFNKKVIKKTTVIYFYMTSQKEKVLKISKYDLKSVVFLNSNDYKSLKKETFIQCDRKHLCHIEYEQFIRLLESDNFKKVDDVDNKIIAKIKNAINNSKTYSYEDKKELTS